MDWRIENHRLIGEGIEHLDTPNRYGWRMAPSGIVEHYTASLDTDGAVSWLMDPEAKASAHLVIGRDGTIVQLAPFDVPAWHAGDGHLRNGSDPNLSTIGVEFVNAGLLEWHGDGGWRTWSNAKVPDAHVVRDDHGRGWHAWSEPGIAAGMAVHRLLLDAYPIVHITGHEFVSPRRKIDPGPFFPWRRFMQLDGRKLPRLAFPGEPFPLAAPGLLRRGARGGDVEDLQRALNDWRTGLTVDGIFGPRTEAAVRAVQVKAGIRVDGIVGPATRAALGLP